MASTTAGLPIVCQYRLTPRSALICRAAGDTWGGGAELDVEPADSEGS